MNKYMQDYVNSLVEQRQDITINEFVKEVNKRKFNIDISFIDEFLELVDKDECCIHHEKLHKYGVISLQTTSQVKRLMEQNNFVEGHDFALYNVVQCLSNGGSTHKKEYYLHPRTFKMCLMRSLKTRKYATYYLLLEECVKYYNDYQTQLREECYVKTIEKKEYKICDLMKKMDEISRKSDLQLAENRRENKKMRKLLKDAHVKLDDTLDDLRDARDEIAVNQDESKTVIDSIARKLDIAVEDRVPPTKNINKREYFVLLKKDTEFYKYYILRGQKSYVDKKINDKQDYKVIKTIEYIPNATNLFNRLRENSNLKDNIKCCGNRLKLTGMSEKKFLKKIDEIYNEKKQVDDTQMDT